MFREKTKPTGAVKKISACKLLKGTGDTCKVSSGTARTSLFLGKIVL